MKLIYTILLSIWLTWSWYQLIYQLAKWFWLKPWHGYDLKRAQRVMDVFALRGDLIKLHIDSPKSNKKFLHALGWYEAKDFDLTIDTRYVRSEKQFVSVLMHEICHHNQRIGKRLDIGCGGWYLLRPIELEARVYSFLYSGYAYDLYCFNEA